MGAADPAERLRVGQCADCAHGRRLASARGSVFWLCRRSEGDPAWARYPRLPMAGCRGFGAREGERDDGAPGDRRREEAAT